MPDFNRVKYRKDGRVTIFGFDDVTVATWKKNDADGWDIEPALPGEKGFKASPRAAGDTTIIEWAKKLNARVNPEAGR